MRTIDPSSTTRSRRKDWLVASTLVMLLILSGALLAVMPVEYVLLIAALLVGLPIASLLIPGPTRNIAIVLLLAFLPLTGILKAITGSRYAPLTFDLGLLIACILFLVLALAKGKIRLGWLDLLFGLFVMVALLQMLNPNVPSVRAGIEGFRKFAFMSIAFFLGRHVLKPKDSSLFVKVTLLVSVPIAIYGLKQFLFLSATDFRMIELAAADPVTYLTGGWVRPFSTMPGPFHLGLYMGTAGLLVLTMLNGISTTPWVRLGLVAALALFMTVLFMTRTKGNWVGFLAGLIVLALIQRRGSRRAFIILASLMLSGTAIVLGISALASESTSALLGEAIGAATNPLAAPTVILRIELWQQSILPALRDNLLLGYGTGSAGEGLHVLYEGTTSVHFRSHNLYLKVLLELGILGLIAFLSIIIACLLRGLKSIYRSDVFSDSQEVAVLQWGIAVVVMFLTAGFVIPTLDAYPVNYYFWLLLGILSRPISRVGADNEFGRDSVPRLEEM